MPRYALRLAYQGTAFHGWWRQPHQRTVAGLLDQAFARLGEGQAAPVGAARTDAGVHATGQVAHVDVQRTWPPGRLLGQINAQLESDCVVTGVASVADDWHACHHARGKSYRYTIDDRAVPDPFQAALCWRTPFRLELTALQELAAHIPAHRDWRGFSRRGEYREDLARTITTCTWQRTPDGQLLMQIRGDGFTYHLVRSLVGACVAVAHGTSTAADFMASLGGEPTAAGAQQAPACGLRLEAVHYSDQPAWITAPSG